MLQVRNPSFPISPRPRDHTPKARRDAGWSSPVARQAHNLKVAGSNPAPAPSDPYAPASIRSGSVRLSAANICKHAHTAPAAPAARRRETPRTRRPLPHPADGSTSRESPQSTVTSRSPVAGRRGKLSASAQPSASRMRWPARKTTEVGSSGKVRGSTTPGV